MVLRQLNRDHSVREAAVCIQLANQLFPGRVSLDAIFGLPNQTIERCVYVCGLRYTWTKKLVVQLQMEEVHFSPAASDHCSVSCEICATLFLSFVHTEFLSICTVYWSFRWKHDLRNIISLCDDHLSLYQLTLERGTQLFHQIRSGTVITASRLRLRLLVTWWIRDS